MAKALALVTLACAISVAVLTRSVQMTPISGDGDRLGESAYNLEKVVAPVAEGPIVTVLSHLFTHTGFLGHLICRFLVNGNGMHKIRELAVQVPGTVPQVYMPIHHLSIADHNAHILAEAATHPDAPAFLSGLRSEATRGGSAGSRAVVDPLSSPVLREAGSVPPPRRVEDYNNMYKQCADGAPGCSLPTQVVQEVLGRIPSLEAELGRIFTSTDAQGALRAAAASDARWRQGKPLSIFDGVPVACKDMLAMKGLRRTEGTYVPPDHAEQLQPIEEEDDVLVKRFRDAGAILIGATVMTEFGITPMGWSVHQQGPRNAYDKGKYSGGSSSGSAVAVAVGLVPVAVGYDGGGSIRLPSSISGIYGLAVSKGRIPSDDHHTSSVVKAGPMAVSARDAALAYTLMAQVDPTSAYTTMYGGAGPPPPHLQAFERVEDLSDVRLGIYEEWFSDADPEIVATVRSAVRTLQARGATLVPVAIPHMQELRLSQALAISCEFAGGHDGQFHSVAAHGSYWWLEPNTRISLGIAQTFTGVELYAANRLRSWGIKYVRGLYAEHNLTAIVTPTVGEAPAELTAASMSHSSSNTAAVVSMMRHIFLANLLGLPGMSVPVGYDKSGLPIGLHAMGDAWQEANLLRIANALETYHFSYAY